jgi:hypothetical protein
MHSAKLGHAQPSISPPSLRNHPKMMPKLYRKPDSAWLRRQLSSQHMQMPIVASIRAAFLAITCLHRHNITERERPGHMDMIYKRTITGHVIGVVNYAIE